MRTTLGTRTTIGTSSDEEGFKAPEDIGDIAGFGGELGGSSGSPSRRSPMGGIDLGKGIDLEKPRAPRSGIGFEVGKSPAGNLGLGLEIPLPVAAPVSARGGVSIDPATGEIRGGYGGLGIGKGPVGASVDVGVDTPKGSENFGCFKYVTFNVGPFSHTVSKNECEPKQPPKGSAAPKTPNIGSNSDDIVPLIQDNKCYHMVVLRHHHINTKFTWAPNPNVFVRSSSLEDIHGQGVWTNNQNRFSPTFVSAEVLPHSKTPAYIERHEMPNATMEEQNSKPAEFTKYEANYKAWGLYNNRLTIVFPGGFFYAESEMSYPSHIIGSGSWIKDKIALYKSYNIIFDISVCEIPCHTKSPDLPVRVPNKLFLPDSSFSLPNPPPTKKKMDDKCCKAIIQLQLETLRLLGRQLGPNGVMAQSKEKGFIGEEIERTLTPIDNPNNPEKVKVRFTTVYQMLMYALKQGIALDTALDPQNYKVPTGKLQNPAYSRDSEHSLKSNDQPSKDKAGNSRELEINKDDAVKMSGFLQQQSYMFKMMQRLEYLFPPGELKDALIAKSLLIPGAKGDIKIHNMIMAYEVQMQYLDATLGNPREILTIKDANPAIEGDQPIEIQSLSVSDLLRQNIKFHIDTGGDVDALVNLVLRDFRTNLANRLDQIKTAEMVQALFEDSGMLEKQEYVDVHLEGDPYAGQWIKGQGFKANPDLEKKTEESTEKVLRETMKPTEQRVKVSRRHKDEKTDMRDLLRGLADFIQRLLSIPSAGDAGKSIDQLVESAKFKIQTDMALLRQNVTQAAAASRNRTRKRKK